MTPQRDLPESEAAALRTLEARYGPQRADDLMITDEDEVVAGSGTPTAVPAWWRT